MNLIFLLLACTTEPPHESINTSVDDTQPRIYTDAALQQNCVSTCSVQDDHYVEIPQTEWLAHLETWSKDPVGEPTLALETLLFYAEQSLALLPQYENKLDEYHLEFLYKELHRDQVYIEMRIVDENNIVRAKMESGDFTLREKQHLPFKQTNTLGWLETAGKVKRVGLSHLWQHILILMQFP